MATGGAQGVGREESAMGKQPDGRSPLTRAVDAVAGLKAGTWESVEALAMLAIEAKDLPEGARILAAAQQSAATLKTGSWDSVRALTWLARADRELGG